MEETFESLPCCTLIPRSDSERKIQGTETARLVKHPLERENRKKVARKNSREKERKEKRGKKDEVLPTNILPYVNIKIEKKQLGNENMIGGSLDSEDE